MRAGGVILPYNRMRRCGVTAAPINDIMSGILTAVMPSRRIQRKRKAVAEPADNPESAQEAKPPLRVCEVVLPGEVLPFRRWLFGLRDTAARVRILARIDRILTGGNFGDHRERIQGAVSELRIDYGSGYRVYYVRHGDLLVIVLGGGTKDGQQSDVEAASRFWEQVKDDVEGHSRDFTP